MTEELISETRRWYQENIIHRTSSEGAWRKIQEEYLELTEAVEAYMQAPTGELTHGQEEHLLKLAHDRAYELVDVLITIVCYCEYHGINLEAVWRTKLDILKSRTWTETAPGVLHHD